MRKPQSFKLITKNPEHPIIVLYTNVRIPAETDLINYYLSQGYEPRYAEKKQGKTVAEMRKELKADEAKLKEFNTLYDAGKFHEACKIYAAYTKAKKEEQK